jgi:mannose-6-phosphate isomerase-like protein (cupin superfamily)
MVGGPAVHVQRTVDAPVNRRSGQESYLLLAKGRFGSQNLAINWVAGAPGSEQRPYAHDVQEQVYVIVRGRGVMHVGDEAQGVEPGTLVFVPPATLHSIRNVGAEPLVYVSATAPPFDDTALSTAFAYQPRTDPGP